MVVAVLVVIVASLLQSTKHITHPSARAPDHWRKKPNTADVKIAAVLFWFQSKVNTPGGSNKGIKAIKKKMVTGVVFHISLIRSKDWDVEILEMALKY